MEILDLTPPQLEWRVYKGDLAQFQITMVDEDDKVIDISSYNFYGLVKNNAGEEIVVLNTYVQDNVLNIQIPYGFVFPNARNYFDVQGNNMNTPPFTVLRGTIVQEGDITF